MKNAKPTMSWVTDKNHLNEKLLKYWQNEYKLLLDDVKSAIQLLESNEMIDSLDREELLIMLNNSVE